jgi:hypothetical protein
MRWPPLATYGHEPTAAELALLRAATGCGPLDAAGLAAVADAARDGSDPGVQRLLPLLHRRPQAGLPAELRAVVEHAYRDAQVRFVRLERELAAVVGALADAGVPVMVLKGYALARAYYASPAHRPMVDLDLAVPPERHAEAAALLARRGLRPKVERLALAVGAGSHALAFAAEDGTEVDLHRNLLPCSRRDGADDGFWARAVPLPVRGRPALTLSPADQLLHACLHGYRENPGASPVRWAADALAVLESGRLDGAAWSVLLAEAGRHRCEGVLRACLAFLAERLGAPVPAGVLDRLAAAPARAFDDAYFRFSGKLPRRPTLAWRLRAAWYDYRRYRGGPSGVLTTLGFPAWVAQRWSVPAAPLAVAAELVRRLPPTRVATPSRRA